MATSSKKYTIRRKVSDTEEEIVRIPYNALADTPDLSVYAKLSGGNAFTGNQQFNQGGYWFATAANHPFVVELENGDALITVNPNGVSFDSDGLGTTPLLINGNTGTDGQVLTSQGASKTPKWGDVSYDNLTDKPTNLVTTDTEQEISGVKSFTNEQGLMTNAIENLNGNRIYDFDSTNNRFGSLANPTHIRGSESRPKYEMPDGNGNGGTVKKDVALTEDLPTKTSQLTNDSDFATTSEVDAKYTKPSGGIPKTDLASDVQTSLDKADTALQTHQDLSNYVDKTSAQNITGKKTVVSPLNTDDSTQIANTAWVRTNYQEKGYAGIDGAVLNDDSKVTDKDGNVVDALYFKVASLTTEKTYMRTYLLAEVAMTNTISEQATVLIRCTTESSTSAPNVTITLDNYSYASLSLPKNIFVTADYKSGTAGATFTVWAKQDNNYMQQVWNVLSQNTRNYTTNSKREWDIFYSNITKATAVTDIDTAPTGYTRIVANNNRRYSNLEENTYLWQQSENAGVTWKRYSDNTTRSVFRHYDDGTTENFVAQSNGFLFRPLNNANTKAIKVDPAVGALYPEQNAGASLGKKNQRWDNAYIQNSINLYSDSSSTPNINMVRTGLESGTNPTTTAYSNLNFGDVNGKNLSVVRNQVTSTGRTSTDLWTRSFGTDYGNYVGFFASPNATAANAEGVWHFSPNLNGKHDLGQSNLRWRNGYITNLQGVKVINGGGGNALIEQDSDTSGADITVGSTSCNLKLQGKAERPTYKSANLALQSDIPAIPYDGNGLSTGTLGGTTYFTSQGRLYFEKTVGLSVSNDVSISGVLIAGCDLVVPIFNGSAINIARVRWDSKEIESGLTVKTVYYPEISLYTTSGSVVSNTSITTGTFKYKVLRSS